MEVLLEESDTLEAGNTNGNIAKEIPTEIDVSLDNTRHSSAQQSSTYHLPSLNHQKQQWIGIKKFLGMDLVLVMARHWSLYHG